MRKKNQPGCPCCSEPITCAGLPTTLYLTDDNGTIELHKDVAGAGPLFAAWYGCYRTNSDSCSDEVFDGNCTVQSGLVAVAYILECVTSSGTPTLTLKITFGHQVETCTVPPDLIAHKISSCTGDRYIQFGQHVESLSPTSTSPPDPLSMSCTIPASVTISGKTLACPVTGTVIVTE